MKIKLFNLVILLFVFNPSTSFAQDEDLSVNTILGKSHELFSKTTKYNVSVNYKMFGNYNTSETLEEFSGKLIKNQNETYLQIHNTIFLTDDVKKTSVKVFKEEQVIEVAKNTLEELNNTSLTNIESFIKLFKQKKVEDKGDYYLCTLTSDYITQIPYGKVEIYINKSDFIITKQVLYFLSKVPYKDKNGEQQEDNPRLEVTLSDFENTLSKEAELLTNLSKYIIKSGGIYKPSATYKDFQIIQN